MPLTRPRLGTSSLLLLTLGAVGCGREKAGSDSGATAPPTPGTQTSVAASTAPPTPELPAQKGQCPLSIVPGVALGPVRIGYERARLDELGLPAKTLSKHERSEIVEVGPFHAQLCAGKVVDTWIDDLRTAPDCVELNGKKVDRSLPRESFIGLFSDCKAAPPRIGGEFRECEDGGVRIGYGMGNFLQVRVGKKGTRLDDSCEMLLDDGSPVPLPDQTRAKLLQATLDLDLLSPFWHPDQPGRDPLHVIENDATKGRPELTIFGSKVVYVTRAEATKKKLAYFEYTALAASSTKTTIEFRFPVEGVVGKVVFRKRSDDWLLEHKQVAER